MSARWTCPLRAVSRPKVDTRINILTNYMVALTPVSIFLLLRGMDTANVRTEILALAAGSEYRGRSSEQGLGDPNLTVEPHAALLAAEHRPLIQETDDPGPAVPAVGALRLLLSQVRGRFGEGQLNRLVLAHDEIERSRQHDTLTITVARRPGFRQDRQDRIRAARSGPAGETSGWLTLQRRYNSALTPAETLC